MKSVKHAIQKNQKIVAHAMMDIIYLWKEIKLNVKNAQ
jgi:hypothetical protein